MNSKRLAFALEQIGPGDWQDFEEFASKFLVDDFPQLRTLASRSGDGGRDAITITGQGKTTTAFQYSVTENWKAKIRATAERISEAHPETRRIFYVTNKQIGAMADLIKEEIFDTHGFILDVIDKSYFLERENLSENRKATSDALATRIVDPILQSKEVASRISGPLTHEESKLALLQIALERTDNRRDRNLTRASFEALVLSVLRGSTSETAVTRDEILVAIETLVPNGNRTQVQDQTVNALGRLSLKKGPLKHNRSTDRYHIAHEYEKEMSERTADYLLGEQAVKDDLRAAVFGISQQLDEDESATSREVTALLTALGRVMQNCGESFYAAISSGELEGLRHAQLTSEVAKSGYDGELSADQAADAIIAVLQGPSDPSRSHLRQLFDSYTMLAFLRATPDVQTALSHVFSDAQIWLDTSAVLPLLAETLIDDPEERQFTVMLQAASASGVELFFTDGVIEETLSHLHGCESIAAHHSREGSYLPYIYGAYVLSGRDPKEFGSWLEEFRGRRTSDQDLREYLEHHFKLNRRSLKEYELSAPEELRMAVQELWYDVHERRRSKGGGDIDGSTVSRLVAHDVENTLGIIQLRRDSPDQPLGHRAWWLTMDRTALRLASHLKKSLGQSAPASPALNPDFLAQLLSLRPRPTSSSSKMSALPTTIFDVRGVPGELLSLAESTRSKYREMSELRIRREVREALLDARIASGRSRTGLEAVEDVDFLELPR